MNRRRLLRRISQGHVQNIRFGDFVNLVEGFEKIGLRGVIGHSFIPTAERI